MKKNLLLFFILTVNLIIYPQVTSVPVHPTEEDSIIVHYDAAVGTPGLKGFTGTVYAHTGVITNLSTSNSDWRYVVADWGVNLPKNTLVKDGTDNYHLVIGNPRQYYNVPAGETIKSLAFVFRNSDGTREGKAAGGADIFLPIYASGLTVTFNNPKVTAPIYGDPLRSPLFVASSDTVKFDISAVEVDSKIATLKLFVNGAEAASSQTNSLKYNLPAANYPAGANTIAAIGTDSSGDADTVSFAMYINSPVVIQSIPGSLPNGIYYLSSSSVLLTLHAPDKKFVYVIGDFNDWKVGQAYYMKRTPDQQKYWVQIDGLEPGKEYAFQYLVDGDLRIADPYTEKTSDQNDQYIPASVYPNLKAYPQGKTSQIASILQTDQQEYDWQVNNFVRPPQEKLVIYELFVRDFVSTHSLQTLIDTIGYFKRLGITAIELMPVNEFEGNESWGYNGSFHFAVDKYYGTRNALKRFVDECHKQGIAVIFDMVLNHLYGQSPLVRLYWNSTLNRPAANSPWFNETSPNSTFSFGYDFNHEKPAVEIYVDRVNRYWLEEFKFDGFRFDFTKGFTQKAGDGSSFDASRIAILKRMADHVWAYDSSAYVILEHFAPNDEEKILTDYGMMVWGNINHEYSEASMGYPSNLTSGLYKTRGFKEPHLVTYMESHDEERMMFRNINYGDDTTNYNIKNLNTALNRAKLAAGFFLPLPGPKMIWQFGELGYDISIDFNGRLGNKPIKWDYYNVPERQNLFKTYAALIDLKKYDTFNTDSMYYFLIGNTKRVNLIHPSMNAAILGNFGVTTLSINPNFQAAGTWYDYFTGDSITITDTQGLLSMQPGELRIYTDKKIPNAPSGILVGVEDEDEEASIVNTYMLEQNYPNPFNPSTTINYQIPQGGIVTLKIYDALGSEVATLIDEFKQVGKYSVNFNASSLASGIYFYRIKVNDFSATKKLILMK